jgi:hypothetical protein
MSTHPPHLELIEGGLTGEDAQWQRFCERIGWQQLGEPTLPEDYEDRLIERIFEAPEHNVVSIDGETFPVSDTIDDGPFPPSRWSARTFGAAIAVVAVVALVVVALSRVVGDAPPAARTVPTPAPERTPAPAPLKPSPQKATPDGRAERLVRASEPERMEPAPRHARTVPAPRRSPAPEHTSEEPVSDGPAMTDEVAAAPAPEPRRRVAAISPEAERTSPSLMSAALPMHLSLGAVDDSMDRRPLTLVAAPSSPTWQHLAMTPGTLGTDHRAVALVDVVEAGRSLRGAL